MDERLLLEGPIGRLTVTDVLQLVAHLPESARVTFECADRVTGAPWTVALELDQGRVVGIGAGAGLRLGDLVVGRGFATRAAVESIAEGAGSRLGMRLVEAGVLQADELEDLVWERHARVVWSLLAWDRGTFRAEARTGAPPAEALVVDPPIPLEAMLLDGLQRAESALAP
jgi:hypothetical protein